MVSHVQSHYLIKIMGKFPTLFALPETNSRNLPIFALCKIPTFSYSTIELFLSSLPSSFLNSCVHKNFLATLDSPCSHRHWTLNWTSHLLSIFPLNMSQLYEILSFQSCYNFLKISVSSNMTLCLTGILSTEPKTSE